MCVVLYKKFSSHSQITPHISTEHFLLGPINQNAELPQSLCHLEYHTTPLMEHSQSQVMREKQGK